MPKAATQARATGSKVSARPAPGWLASRPFAAQREPTAGLLEADQGRATRVAVGPSFSFGRLSLQPKLTVGRSDDPFEEEADRLAECVMRMPAPELSVASTPVQLNRKCAACEEDEAQTLRTKLAGSREASASEAPGIVHEVLASPGQPLDTSTRAYFEPRFGRDLSGVRVHADGEAANAARAVQARAYTIGRDIVFGREQFQPATSEGKLLLAHELAHVVQQRGSDARVAHRQADESPLPPSAASQSETGATERLRAIIADIERVWANASRNPGDAAMQEGGEPETNGHAEKIAAFLEQLRAVASGNDEELKMRVLTGFSSQGMNQAEAKLAEADATVREKRPVSVAAKTLGVSHPGDAAEIEADRVAQAVVHGSGTTVTQATPGGLVSRQSGALAAAGGAILGFEAVSLPLTSWNPPGWVLDGLATVLAAALIGTAGVATYMGKKKSGCKCLCYNNTYFNASSRAKCLEYCDPYGGRCI